nr:nucleolar protein dao-5 isoform X2 [Helicoverpa armigera]
MNGQKNDSPKANKRKNTEENETPKEISLPKKRRISAAHAKKTVQKKPAVGPKQPKASPKSSLSLRKATRTRTLKALIRSNRFNTLEKLINERDSKEKPQNGKESDDELSTDDSDDDSSTDGSDSESEYLPSSPAQNNIEQGMAKTPEAEEPSINSKSSMLENLPTASSKANKETTEKPTQINTKQLQNICNTIIEVKSKIKAVYEESKILLKKSFEDAGLNVPELNYISTLITDNIQPTSSKIPPSFQSLGSPNGQLLSPTPSDKSRSETTQKEGLSSEEQSSEDQSTSEGPSTSEGTPKPSSSNQRADTKWTLRHQGPGIGLIELMPHTGVYVLQAELKYCETMISDMKKFARALLPLIFTKEALNTCTYTGSKPKMKCPENFEVRPGLDENARMTLVTYVRERGKKLGWNDDSPEAIVTSLKNKLQVQKYRANLKKNSNTE